MIERSFAGELRQFALRPSAFARFGPMGYEVPQFGNLVSLWKQAEDMTLSEAAVRHVITHALAGPDDPVALIRARRLVADEMDGQSVASYIALARIIIIEAVVGSEQEVG